MRTNAVRQAAALRSRTAGWEHCRKSFRGNADLYLLFLLPGLVFLFIFKYIPMGGIVIAFQDYNIFAGILGSEWKGFANFQKLIGNEEFYRVFMNTLIISVYKLLVNFPVPVLIAILLNEIRAAAFKRTMQTVICVPHFLSWVIVSGMCISLLSPSSGVVNNIIVALGGEPISFMMSNEWFRSILVISDVWKEGGWGAIVYIAAIAGIDQELYEAARVDGAGRFRQMLHITLPGISATIVVMLLLKLGYLIKADTEQILMMYNPTVYETADTIGTYVYRLGIGKMDYSFSTAVGLLESVIGLILLLLGNAVSRKLVHQSIW